MSDFSSRARPVFDPLDASFDPNDVTGRDDVESPSLSSSNALARFEFEPGRSKDGTKVLMVEWEDDAATTAIKGDWEIRWQGKKTVLPAREQSGDGENPVNRLYFLLGHGVSVPSTVKLQKGSIIWRTNPLPAIFSPELGATARQAGKKGVLHTIWAKKRLQVLQREIENESKNNVEGIGLEMAIAEKEWIEQNFGVQAKTGSTSTQGGIGSVNSPSSPSKSPGGGRLMDKLKGLKLGTGVEELHTNRKDGQSNNQHNPLSPETSDVAVGSFGSFAEIKGQRQQSQAERKVAPQTPPASVSAQQRRKGGDGSLNALANDSTAPSTTGAGEEKQDDLFALPMSPRSPGKSPAKSPGKTTFSFGTQDTRQYV